MRYDKLRKISRNKELVKYREEHTGYSWREVGEAFNVTASRAYRIVQKEKEVKE